MIDNPYQAPEADLSRDPRGAAAPPLWNPDAIGNWSLVLTPLFGAVLVARNWRALGEPGRARAASAWFYVGIPLYFFALALPVAGFALLVIWYFLSNRLQAKYVRERFGNDYPRQPWLGPIFITLGLFFCIATLFVLIARTMSRAGYS